MIGFLKTCESQATQLQNIGLDVEIKSLTNRSNPISHIVIFLQRPVMSGIGVQGLATIYSAL